MNKQILFKDYAQALVRLENALIQPVTQDLMKAGCIQYFEFTFELAWKSIKSLANEVGISEVNSPRACLKEAFRQGWIDVEEPWLSMLNARNKMSHTYDSIQALEVYSQLLEFSIALRNLLKKLESQIS
jgi:nucleotidyltransferase substrate binding protein (TIGR01987 family)